MHDAYMHFGRYCNYYGSCGLWCARSFHHHNLGGICPMDRTDLRRRAFLCSYWILRVNNAISYSHWSCRHGETSSIDYCINCSHRLHNNSCNQFSLWQRLQTLYTPFAIRRNNQRLRTAFIILQFQPCNKMGVHGADYGMLPHWNLYIQKSLLW